MIWVILMFALLIGIPFLVSIWFKAHAEADRRDAERAKKIDETLENFEDFKKGREDER